MEGLQVISDTSTLHLLSCLKSTHIRPAAATGQLRASCQILISHACISGWKVARSHMLLQALCVRLAVLNLADIANSSVKACV